MDEKSIAIVGGGIAGLSAGCYARMNGYRTTIFEMHTRAGGVCTGWKRNGYTVDGCIHWLVGTAPGNDMNTIWMELGALQGREIVDHEEFMRIVSPDGKRLSVYTDIGRFERHLLELAPGDAKAIRRFARAVRKLGRLEMPADTAPELRSFLGKVRGMVKLLPFVPTFMRYSKITMQDFAGWFEDEFVREALGTVFDFEGFPLMATLFTFAWLNRKDAGYPVGGSLDFARAIEKRYTDLGGEIRYGAKVAKIIVEDGRAVGVRLKDESEHRADWVISAADGHATIFDMLDGRYGGGEVKSRFGRLRLFDPLVYVALGIKRDLSTEPHHVTQMLAEPVRIAERERRKVGYAHYCYDPTLAPAGKSVVVSMIDTDYDYWKKLAAAPDKYRAEKADAADKVIAVLERRYPGISGDVEMTDVATPLTFERYTGNWRGAYEGWMITTETMMAKMKKTLPGLDRFYIIGQWVNPGGGLPPAAMDGRFVTQIICSRDRRHFVTSRP